MKQLLFFFCFLMYFVPLKAQNSIIPKPSQITYNEEQFTFKENVQLEFDQQNYELDTLLHWFTKDVLHKNIVDHSKNSALLKVSLNPNLSEFKNEEAYLLEVKSSGISITAKSVKGVFYALQSLAQLIPVSKEPSESIIKGLRILDAPKLAWRGLMLDVSRHFFSVEELKTYIDMMSKYKFNVFHWHLTDDHGWRIQIKAFPKLTSIGAWRVARTGKFGLLPAPKINETNSYGGFYTQDEIKDIVAYAQFRQITIVPEIDIPGHSMALLAAYPQFSTLKQVKYVSPGNKFSNWYANGTFSMQIENMLNPADEKVYGFLDTIFTEVAALFPGSYIHTGGDECDHAYWMKSPSVKVFMRQNNIKDGHALQSYFMQRVAQIISSKGKKMIAWDEVLDPSLDKNVAIMNWHPLSVGVKASQLGYPVVLSPAAFCYLDYTQGDRSIEFPIYDNLSLRKAYNFDPLPSGMVKSLVLGGQANLWTEHVPTMRHAFYMTYPRAFATIESLWSESENKNWNDFIYRVEQHFNRFDLMQANIAKAIYDPIIEVQKNAGNIKLTLSSDIPELSLYYSLDQTFPDEYSLKYISPIAIPAGAIIFRVQAYRNGKPIGRMISLSKDDLLKR